MHSNAKVSKQQPQGRRFLGFLSALCLGATAAVSGGCETAGQGAFSGAMFGSLAGLTLGSLTGDAGEGATTGAILGALAGGVIGDQNDRQHTYGSCYNTPRRGHKTHHHHHYAHTTRHTTHVTYAPCARRTGYTTVVYPVYSRPVRASCPDIHPPRRGHRWRPGGWDERQRRHRGRRNHTRAHGNDGSAFAVLTTTNSCATACEPACAHSGATGCRTAGACAKAPAIRGSLDHVRRERCDNDIDSAIDIDSDIQTSAINAQRLHSLRRLHSPRRLHRAHRQIHRRANGRNPRPDRPLSTLTHTEARRVPITAANIHAGHDPKQRRLPTTTTPGARSQAVTAEEHAQPGNNDKADQRGNQTE